ncbi:unnamed protein product [Chondrus crispus]|uniref:Uncharacterized protein n=1 Tax=Chondrus crispus TaxID=2769 RepID=R7QMQ8_CHOCR|nr:unnamed protein product [Chondrus crispus]CDF39028.1 unnamed protein product [Chondrus crispus]|eukprot:XP_005718933.1 unnamed protein product [Chondrus crispus]
MTRRRDTQTVQGAPFQALNKKSYFHPFQSSSATFAATDPS